MRKSILHIYTLYLLFSIAVFHTISCKSTDKENVDQDLKVNVQFDIGGIMEEPVSEIQASLPNSINSKQSFSEHTIIEGDNFIIEGGSANNSTNTLHKKNINKSASLTPIPPGIRVRLLVYEVDANGNEIFKNNLGVPVQQDFFAITLEKNRKYKFYAYSFNSFTTYPPSPLDEDNPVIRTANDNALIYAGGGITILNDPVHVNVIFRHVTSRISVGVDAQSYFAEEITDININLNNVPLTTHNLDLRTGNLVGNVQTTTTSNLSFDFANFENSPAKKLSQNRLYTSTTLNSYSYTINSLVVKKNGISETLISADNPRVVTASGFTGPLTTVYFSRNYVYPAINIGNNIWATGNLFYLASAAEGLKYKFDIPRNTALGANCNYYFNWNTQLSRNETNTTSHSTGDPCALVYPVGKWKTPSEADYNLLIDNSTITNEGTGAIKFQNSPTGRSLIFHQAGWLFGLGCNVTNETDGQYWTSSTGSLGVLGRLFEVGNESDNAPRYAFDSEAKSIGASVRCIRN